MQKCKSPWWKKIKLLKLCPESLFNQFYFTALVVKVNRLTFSVSLLLKLFILWKFLYKEHLCKYVWHIFIYMRFLSTLSNMLTVYFCYWGRMKKGRLFECQSRQTKAMTDPPLNVNVTGSQRRPSLRTDVPFVWHAENTHSSITMSAEHRSNFAAPWRIDDDTTWVKNSKGINILEVRGFHIKYMYNVTGD